MDPAREWCLESVLAGSGFESWYQTATAAATRTDSA
jgi:hypothetical protein